MTLFNRTSNGRFTSLKTYYSNWCGWWKRNGAKFWFLVCLNIIIGSTGFQVYQELFTFIAHPVEAQVIMSSKKVVEVSKDVPIPPKEIKPMLDYWADKFGVDRAIVYKVVNCESQFDPSRLGDYVGKTPMSFGLWQWHLVDHPEVSKKCAMDAECSTVMAMMHITDGFTNWTCYRREILGENI